ncbi:MAG TPA: hypothetical protein PK796_07830 [Bacteroidales bacterium]|nr:hypothetical protein [Bacteroidales bacterium]
MKTKLISLSIAIFFAMLITGCGGAGSSSVNNEILNKLPSIAKDYDGRIKAKEKEINECTDMEKVFKLEKEVKLLKEEWETKIKESNASNPVNKSVPYDALADAPFQVSQVTIDPAKVYKSNVTLVFDVSIPTDIKNEYGMIEKNLFIYYLALDKSGNEIPGVVSVAASTNRVELKSGTKPVVTGQLGPLSKLENFARLKLISREEYDQKKK